MNLEQIISSLSSISVDSGIKANIVNHLNKIGELAYKQKGVYTVLTTLLYYKYLNPNQDVRYHQDQLENGFSGRSFDTKNVTPILKKMGFPAMAESGWLTRSLEQPYPYDMNYSGKISSNLRIPFLESLQYVQENPNLALSMLVILLRKVKMESEKHTVEIHPLENPDNLTIDIIIKALGEHFSENYRTHNGAKLPVLAFYAIYQSLIKEMKRYEGCTLAPLSSLTACDRTNKASGDIEIFRGGKLFESVEIKLDRKINEQIIQVVKEKIYKWNPQRYYVLSVNGVEESDVMQINNIVYSVGKNHGCQIIINGLIPTLKYYLRLITDLNEFIINYSSAVQEDKELQVVHKEKWQSLILNYGL